MFYFGYVLSMLFFHGLDDSSTCLMAKSFWVTYILWLFGGWLGLHLIYLRRDRHAFLWICTLGGGFGCGWIRDFLRIPEYVKDANNDDEFILELKRKIRSHRTPRELMIAEIYFHK